VSSSTISLVGPTPSRRSGRSLDVTSGDPSAHAVVTAAEAVFAERGLSAPLAEVARRAGVGVASVYRRFANKDDLISRVYEPRLAAAHGALRAALENPDAGAAFEGYFRNSLRDVVEDKGFRELTLGAYAGTLGWSRSGPPVQLLETVARTEQTMVPLHVELVRRAQASGHLRADMEPPDMLILTMAALSTAEFAGGGFPGLPDRVATVILDGLRAGAAAKTELPASPVNDAALQAVRSKERRRDA
jgi:AcrR family transcriptional regulator